MVSFENIKNMIHGTVIESELLKRHTSYKIGGPADFFIQPANDEDIINVLKYFRTENYPYFILGNGSNLLFSDKGYRGAVIDISEYLKEMTIYKNELTADAGASIAKVARFCAKYSFSGFERISGIPGSIGGALIMNAGSYGDSISDNLRFVEVINKDLEKVNLNKSDIGFNYRKSDLQGNIILRAVFTLVKGDSNAIEAQMKEYGGKRTKSQPLTLPSCGSVFKKVGDTSAAVYIQDAGLKGYTVGGAMVSKKHGNFIVNFNNAKASDILQIIEHVKNVVAQKFNVELEEEVKLIGEK